MKLHLESWIWDGDAKCFHGRIFGHRAFGEGTRVSLKANFVAWDARWFRLGDQIVKLGKALADEYYEQDEGEFPWPDSAT